MKLEQEILVNQYGQGIVDIEKLISLLECLSNENKRLFLNDLLYLIMQSKPMDEDINEAIIESGLKPTYTPCVLLKKGVAVYNLKKIIELPNNELEKVITLLLVLFKIAYRRRFEKEKIIRRNGGIGIYLTPKTLKRFFQYLNVIIWINFILN